MDSTLSWDEGTVYLRHTTNGKGTIQAHRCWSCERFISQQLRACEEANVQRKSSSDPLVGVEVCTREQYIAERRR